MTPIELAREHLEVTATTDARDRRERSASIAAAAAALAAAEAMIALTVELAEGNRLTRELLELRLTSSADGIRELLKPPAKGPKPSESTGAGAIG